MKLICCDNIFSDKANIFINKLMSSDSNFLYLSSSPNVMLERKKHKDINILFSNNPNVLYFREFLNICAKEVYNTKNYLPNLDVSYILKVIIRNYFKDEQLLVPFYDVSQRLFKLYKILMLYGIEEISENTMELIKNNSLKTDYYIFDIYNKLIKEVKNIVNCFSKGKNEEIYKIWDLAITAPENSDENFNTFIYAYKKAIHRKLSSSNKIIIDGFFYFSEEVNYLINCAIKLKKEVILITKNIKEDDNAKFLVEEIKHKCLIGNESLEYIILKSEVKNETGLDYLKNHFYDKSNLNSQYHSKLFDGSINIIKPFLSREKEMEFVAQEISNIIKKTGITDTQTLENILRDDIVIVTAVSYNQLSESMDNAFKKYGIFIMNNFDSKDLLNKEVDLSTVNKIYYTYEDFLSSDVFYCDGELLSIDEKALYFSKCYEKINIMKEEKCFMSSPVLEYIIQLYDIFKEGISKKSLKLLLFSNWYYHTGRSKIKWDKYIGTFNQIEEFLQDNVLTKNWIMQLEDILKYKEKIDNNSIFKFHPFSSVSKEEIEFLLYLLKDIDNIISSLSKINGNIQCHIDFIKEHIINSAYIVETISETDLSEEQKSIKEFYNYIKNIVSYSTIKNINTEYFSEYLKTLFSWEQENISENNKLTVRLSSMINLKNYKYTFFIGCENDNYPRKNNVSFPFTQSIIEILNSKKYGINIKKLDVKTDELNLKLEKYLFKNVIDFTTEKIYYTCTEYADKGKRRFSTYINDIAETFNQDLIYNYESYEKGYVTTKPNLDVHMYVDPKEKYTLKELVTFYLCPKLYYHLYLNPTKIAYTDKSQLKLYAQAVIYSKLLDDFMNYNKENKKWYFSGEKEVYKVLDKLMEDLIKQDFKFWDCLSIPDLLDIKNRVKIRIEKIIEDYIIGNLKYHKYTIVPSRGKVYRCRKYDIALEYDTAIFCDKPGSRKIDQSKIFLDFLTLKCTDREVKEKHYKEMVDILHGKNKLTDRVFFANRMISKINIQFDSNNDRFINGFDGAIERIDKMYNEILKTDFLNISPYPSNFCNYCIVRDICMGEKESRRGLEVIQ